MINFSLFSLSDVDFYATFPSSWTKFINECPMHIVGEIVMLSSNHAHKITLNHGNHGVAGCMRHGYFLPNNERR